MKYFSQKQGGFTLIETIIAVFIFSVIALGVSAIFAQVLVLQRRGSGAQKAQENAMFFLESLGREIRVSTITNQNQTDCSLTVLTMNHPVIGTIAYSASAGQVTRQVNTDPAVVVSSKDVVFDKLNFCVQGTAFASGSGDQKQIRVTIIAQVSNAGTQKDMTTFKLQTTVVSRDTNTEFTSQ